MKPLLATVLLEPNRWKGQPAHLRLAAWLERIRQAGFEALEIWEGHYLEASEADRAALRVSERGCYFNSYAPMEDAATAAEHRQRSVQATRDLGAAAVKFNVGKDPARTDEYIGVARGWAEAFPPNCKLLCECHPGTVLETPDAARQAFAQWDARRFGAIIHPLAMEAEQLRRWCEALGPRLAHLHLQTRGPDERFARLRDYPERIAAAGEILREFDFAGTATIEFTAGVGQPGENPAQLLDEAREDLHCFLPSWP